MEKQFVVYIFASKRNGTLYVGRSSQMPGRLWAHKNDLVASFTQKYKVHRLVYYEMYNDKIESAAREYVLKKWHCAWKIALIEKDNPYWRDLFKDISG